MNAAARRHDEAQTGEEHRIRFRLGHRQRQHDRVLRHLDRTAAVEGQAGDEGGRVQRIERHALFDAEHTEAVDAFAQRVFLAGQHVVGEHPFGAVPQPDFIGVVTQFRQQHAGEQRTAFEEVVVADGDVGVDEVHLAERHVEVELPAAVGRDRQQGIRGRRARQITVTDREGPQTRGRGRHIALVLQVEHGGGTRAGQHEEIRAVAGVIAGLCRCAAEAELTVAGVTGRPLEAFVAEIDVEVAGTGIGTIAQDELEVVRLVRRLGEITDGRPRDGKRVGIG